MNTFGTILSDTNLPDKSVYFEDSGILDTDSTNFQYDKSLPQLAVGPLNPLYNFPEVAMNIGGNFGSMGSPDYISYTVQNTSSYGSSDFVCANDLDDGTVLTGVYGDFGIAGSTYAPNGGTDINQGNDVYLYTSESAGNLNIYAQGIGKVINFATAGDTVDQIRLRIEDIKTTNFANKDVELSPALTNANWTEAGGWGFATTPNRLVLTSNAGPNTIEPTTPLVITPGLTYYIVIEASATSGAISYTIGGRTGSAITAGTTTDFLTATTSGNLVITGAASATATITAVSVRALIPNTGTLEVQGGLILGGGITKTSGAQVMNIDGDSVVTFSQIPFVPVALPTQDYQVANKYYVDTFSQGLVPYLDVQLATTADITLLGEQTIDGVMTSASRVMVKNQTLQKDNGIYTTGAGAWTRTTDFDTTAEVKMGAFFYVTSGSTQNGNRYAQYSFNPASDTLGVDPINFTIISQAGFGVTNFSMVTANGFSGSVANPSSTPALTISTTVTGLLQGNGSAISAVTIGSGLTYLAGTLSAAGITGTGTDNHIVRWNGTTAVQDSELVITDIGGGIVNLETTTAELWINAKGDGNYLILTTADTTSGTSGGIDILPGVAFGSSTGGSININAGQGGATGLGGATTISAGYGGQTSGNGGILRMYGGSPAAFAGNNNGGDIWLTPGSKSGAGTVGKLRLYSFNGANFSANLDTSLVAASAGDKTFTFPAQTGILVATPDPNANTIYGWDDTDGLPVNITIGTGLTYTHSTHTLSASGGTGDVVGPASATDNALVRFDTTTGKLIQNSLVTLDDTGHIIAVAGSAATPSYSFSGSTSTGIYLQAVNQMAISVAGATKMVFGAATTTLSSNLVVTGSIVVNSGTIVSTSGGVGYAAGAGGAVTQLTSKSTGVTLNKICGQIVMNNAALGAGAEVSFVLTNTTIAATDVVIPTIASGGTVGSYAIVIDATAAGNCTFTLTNLSAGSLSQAVVINFVVFKSVNA